MTKISLHLGTVALATALAALLFRSRTVRTHFGLIRSSGGPGDRRHGNT